MKILIVRYSSIGDIVLTTPVIRCVKKQTGAQVHYVTKKAFKTIIESNPYVDKAFYIDEENYDSIVEQLQMEAYDYVIDLHNNVRTLKLKRLLKRKTFSFYKLNIQKWLLTALKINVLPKKVHIVDRYMDTVRSLGVKNDGAGLDYFIPEKDQIKDSDLPLSHVAGYIGVVIGAALGTKQLPVEKIKAICAAIDHPLVLLGGKEDAANGELIAAIDPIKIYNACGKFNLNESADLVRKSKFIITHDTGLMHIATAFNKRVVSIWGNTVPDFGMYPYYGERFLQTRSQLPYEIVETKGLWCRPCSKIGFKTCPRGHFKCMKRITVEEVMEAVKKVW